MSAHCRKAGIGTEIIPLHDGFTGEGFDFVCCSFVTVHDYKAALPYLEKIVVPKLAGGVYARKGAQIDGFDYVCRGEGQRIVDFFLHGDTAVFESALVDDDMDILPDYSGVTGYEFGRGVPFLMGKKMIPYSHSRGCPYKCSFCEMRNLPQTVRIKKSIRQDLEYLRKAYHPELFYFTDETLPYYSKEWRDQFDGNTTPFLSFIRADIEPEHLDFLIKNGLHSCAIGVESGDEEYRNAVLNKGVTNKQIFRTVEALDRAGVERIMLFMRNTPGENILQAMETFDMAEKLGGYTMIFDYEVL